MTLTKTAVLKHPDAREQKLNLFRVEAKCYRWLMDSGRPFDGIDYVNEATAISQLRVLVDGDPAYVGVDLTIHSIEPTADVRAAKRIRHAITGADCLDIWDYESVAEIIRSETNLPALMDSIQSLLAYCFKCRPAFAKALFPVTAAGAPRDLTMDGLLLAVIEALEKTSNQKFDNLTKILKAPVSQIQVAKAMPKGKPN